MKLTIRHPAGVEISFEGDESEFGLFKQFMADPPQLVGAPPATTQIEAGSGSDGSVLINDGSLNAQAVAERLAKVGAATDVEKVTVMAQIAVDAGRDGIDYGEVDRLFEQLGERKPANMRQTFSNGKRSGLVRSVGHGRWKPTVTGENFARLGVRPRRGRRGGAPQLAPSGGERGD